MNDCAIDFIALQTALIVLVAIGLVSGAVITVKLLEIAECSKHLSRQIESLTRSVIKLTETVKDTADVTEGCSIRRRITHEDLHG